LFVGITVKSTPEECGLYPDGADAPVTMPVERQMSFREVFANKNSYMLILSFGFLQFVIVGVMAFYVTRLDMVGTAQNVYLLWLSIAAVLGIPFAYLLGYIDDKLGTVVAAIVLSCFFLLALVFLLIMRPNNIGMIVFAALGIAGMTGGTSVIHPSITTYVYGRENYQAANRWIMAFQAVIMAFAIYFMASVLKNTGTLNLAYQVMIGMTIVAILCFLVIGRTPDFDRGRK
jgi:OFA family oxalate/formate antiporter-like MFS transporter